jgi:hypothetical protein
MDLADRSHYGETAVEAHSAEIGGGQDTEPFQTQALDAITNILHAAKANWEGDGEFNADHLVQMAVIHFNCEQEEA